MHPSRAIFLLCIGFLAGVAVGPFWGADRVWWPAAAGAILWLIAGRRPGRAVGMACLLFGVAASAGVWRFQAVQPDITAQSAQYLEGVQTELKGTIIDEPDRRVDHQNVRLQPATQESLIGDALVSLPLYPDLAYGDKMAVQCTLKTPETIETFDYPAYLALSHVTLTCFSGRVVSHEPAPSLSFRGAVFAFKQAAMRRIGELLPEPHASFLAGLLVGARSGIPNDLKEAFNRTGVTHIIAISGFNITIIATIITSILAPVVGRKRAFWMVIGVLIIFVVMTGMQASVIRAAIMGVLVLLARQTGRGAEIRQSLALAAGIMVWINPNVLLDDAGFQLSFCATIGLVSLSPIVEPRLRFLPKAFAIRESAGATISATIMTLPLIAGQFGRVSYVAPVVNVLVLWMIPVVMAVGTLTLIASVIHPLLGAAGAFCTWLCLTYIIRVIEAADVLPWIAGEIRVPGTVVLGLYGLLAILVWWVARRSTMPLFRTVSHE